MPKVAIIVGTRPEAIKMAPIAIEARRRRGVKPVLILTAQHRKMCDDVLEIFKLKPDHDLDIMKPRQSLFEVTARLVRKLEKVLTAEKPDIVLVQGDTTSTFVGSLAAYYLKIPVGHVEAGLRTYRKYSPFPEEINRKLTSALADLHFAATPTARDSLLSEGVPRRRISVVGNPVIDALLHVASKKYRFSSKQLAGIDFKRNKVIAVTAHRRESWGRSFEDMMRALREITRRHAEAMVVFPVHPNPNVRHTVKKILGGAERVLLIDPLDYRDFVKLLKSCSFIITDSGGIQEEAPSLKKPVLLMREVTERPEAVKAGAVKIVGTDKSRIVSAATELLKSEKAYRKMLVKKNPYGDGHAARKIMDIIAGRLGEVERP
ncbi:non-hydrolyzing UDP-N-acetylglucosamine 2-epimerase [Candidatus Eisenbacteria bacterium]|uniref:UDP-N-acetylglucosamine 2-epimerase (non-hydrolyzing) n=1 Tax=Eiseniibacteriota bacterium TaxID=2212470 RepID=A0ABV6YNJ2_UNCEI